MDRHLGGRDQPAERRQDQRLHHEAGTLQRFVLSIFEDREGSLWIGTYGGGLNRMKDGRVVSHTTAPDVARRSVSSGVVRALYADGDGNLWIGTDGGGLNRLRGGKFTSFTQKNGLSNDIIMTIHDDGEGSLWLGTYGGGLNRLRNGTFTAYTSKQGLFSDVVYQILDDGNGHFWMSSNKGVFRVSKRELDGFDRGAISIITSRVYGTVDGMKSAECNDGSPGGWRTRDGRIWFATAKGVVSIDPKAPDNPLPPRWSSRVSSSTPRPSIPASPPSCLRDGRRSSFTTRA